MSKIVVQIDGQVQEAFIFKDELLAPGPFPTGVIVVDLDTEGLDGDEVIETLNSSGGLVEALVFEEPLGNLKPGSDVDSIVRAFLEPALVADTRMKKLPLIMGKIQSKAGKESLANRFKGDDNA